MLNITSSASETTQLGKDFVMRLRGGEVVLLLGDLGAGKTTFVKGAAQGLGVKKTVTSPTFVIMKAYEAGKRGKIKQLVHIDTYRAMDISELENIGATEYFGRKDTVCFVEWGAGIEEYLREKKITYEKIEIRNIDESKREFSFN